MVDWQVNEAVLEESLDANVVVCRLNVGPVSSVELPIDREVPLLGHCSDTAAVALGLEVISVLGVALWAV